MEKPQLNLQMYVTCTDAHVPMHTRAYAYTYTHAHAHSYTQSSIHMCVFDCVYERVCVRAHVHVCTRIEYIYVYVYVLSVHQLQLGDYAAVFYSV